jgi:ABC-type nitrate/sulfonate/bicarbonate transport system substrate-binding protein
MVEIPAALRGRGATKRRRARRLRALGVLAVIGFLAVGGAYVAGSSHQSAPSRSDTIRPPSDISPISMRLMGGFGPEFAGEMLAVRAGLFTSEALQVELLEAANSGEAIASSRAGANMIGVARADSFLEARGKGAPIVAFAASFIESPVAFYVLKASGLRGAQDFAGRRIGRRAGDDTEVSFEALVTKLGLPRSITQEIAVASDISMLVKGGVEVWPGHVGKADYALTKQGAEYIAVSPGSYGVHLPGSVYFASEQTIREHPQVIQSFLGSVIGGWQLAYASVSLSAPMIASFKAGEVDDGLRALRARPSA